MDLEEKVSVGNSQRTSLVKRVPGEGNGASARTLALGQARNTQLGHTEEEETKMAAAHKAPCDEPLPLVKAKSMQYSANGLSTFAKQASASRASRSPKKAFKQIPHKPVL